MPEFERRHPACRECREKKLRCVPNQDNEDNSCDRCVRLGKNCEIPEVKRRQRKARLRGRVDQLESSYSEILSLLKRNANSSPNETSGPGSGGPPSIIDIQSQTASTKIQSLPTNASGISNLSLEECESLLSHYRRMSQSFFPYVIVPETCQAASVIQERPMLAQAIFIVTTWRNPIVQSPLQAQFLKELGERYFIKSERSLDLLQGLIVYFGWCHWYATPFAYQAFRHGSLVASLAVELGITQRPMSITQHDIIVNAGAGPPPTNEAMSSKFWCYEARRALAGAYIISIFCYYTFRKLSPLTYTQYIDDCAASLAADPQYASDATIIHQVRSFHIAEQTTDVFDQDSKEKFGDLNDEKVQILVKTLAKNLDDWRAALPVGTSENENARHQQWYFAGRAYIHEVGLYGLLQGQTPSVTRISIIYECFVSAMKYLSEVLELTLDDMADWTSLDWRALNFCIMLCTKSSIILDATTFGSGGAGPEASQRAAWLYKCLDTLCMRTRELRRLVTTCHNPVNNNTASDASGGVSNGGAGVPQSGDSRDRDRDHWHFFKRLATDWAHVKICHQNCTQKRLSITNTNTSSFLGPTTNATANTTSQQHAPTTGVGNMLPGLHQSFTQEQQTSLEAFNRFDMDPINDLFWVGLTDSDTLNMINMNMSTGSMNSIFQM
ncbi:uncharacterized protein Z518_00464 [Rhinocladiella mackenziei CBS 650.93]|uniref:Rhinocladiella mackenziei CBS 650.93 unplaced genomic scaffold supercont1.1, whole genome shotgun sequence n=1 Tax=Rhinocladiella mackenziei CBS 650.93 TaxID=1442369 RepID=A0A0D2JIZ5_9EURO|nr:uncharacterized protein Z518_00464 [Rhinocladiella mackenziei CBS 650.93]KIX09385.1 hypothetical protein Z518_00464 [Rhinocladiella mackenziei CBS 650.93]